MTEDERQDLDDFADWLAWLSKDRRNRGCDMQMSIMQFAELYGLRLCVEKVPDYGVGDPGEVVFTAAFPSIPMDIGWFGCGRTEIRAVADYVDQISGKLLEYDDKDDGQRRRIRVPILAKVLKDRPENPAT